jgi:hypothetical protein
MKEIPQKGWYILKTEKHVPGSAEVYLDGKKIGGIQKASVNLDAEMPFCKLTLEIIPIDGLIVDTIFGPLVHMPDLPSDQEETVFCSSQTPEEILKALEIKEKEVQETS